MPSTTTAPARCLYDVLGVPRDATSDAIRGAYRKLALQLHPDKAVASGSSQEEATSAFQELLRAYEVLSDPKERSYYDSHRSQILFSNPNSHTTSYSSSSFSFTFDVSPFFSASCYSGFSDTGRGFYKVYADVFDRIYAKELEFQSMLGLPEDAVPPAPSIGNSDSPYDQARAFYDYWLGFTTVMDFAWADAWDARAGVSRRDRRAMEEENRKARRRARREYNETIRGLADHCKKRDKRVAEMALRRKQEEERKRREGEQRRREEEKMKVQRARAYVEPEWAKAKEEEEEEENEQEVVIEDVRDSVTTQLLYCVACGKKFKSEKQWVNHERSKKHREKVAELKEAMLEEENSNDEVGGHNEVDGGANDAVDDLCKEFDERMEVEEESLSRSADQYDNENGETVRPEGMVPGQMSERIQAEDGDESESSGRHNDDEESVLESMVSIHKTKDGDSKDEENVPLGEVVRGPEDSDEDGSVVYDTRKKARRNRAKNKGGKGGKSVNGNAQDKCTSTSSQSVDVDDRSDDFRSGKKKNNKKQQVDERDAGKGRKNKGPSKTSNLCETCGETFESRNRLFMHLGESGHAMVKSR